MKAFVTVRATIEAEYEIDNVTSLADARGAARDRFHDSFKGPGFVSESATSMNIESISAEEWE